ncbi:uncharacterized protein K441DRAFT_723812 [Cenococcum geophilum 1.58]|uniref:uncharacterized protein n=1 Tax=Cenococcum geophilum 1.58 TaxID=794803 RepID=UPI00358E36E7|nr:hypothetical protein K441DRAFT_723812 [Cenococcum geophilum 1.58]
MCRRRQPTGQQGLALDNSTINTWDVTCLIINKMIGCGIFIFPPLVARLVGNKMVAMMIWIFGSLYPFCSIYIYLGYGDVWPFNGGELIYVARTLTRPPIISMCLFAWFFVAFSPPAGTSLAFAQFIVPAKAEHPDPWFVRYIATLLIVVISFISYRCPAFIIWANRILGTAKVLLIVLLVFVGAVGYTFQRYVVPEFPELPKTFEKEGSTLDIALAILLVLYCYSGWENANYVASEIYGGRDTHTNEFSELRIRNLRKGALLGVSVVSLAYCCLNLFMLAILEIESISDKERLMAVKSLPTGLLPPTCSWVSFAISIFIALSAMGSVIGVTFTNSRVIRQIAKEKLLPKYDIFQGSSEYGISAWDGNGTPSGALFLHGALTCVAILLTPIRPGFPEGLFFTTCLFFFGHSMLCKSSGLPRPGNSEEQPLICEFSGHASIRPCVQPQISPWNFLRLLWTWFAVVLFTSSHLFIVIMLCFCTKTPDGTPRRTRIEFLPIIVLLVCSLGLLYGIYILLVSWDFHFENPINPNNLEGRVTKHRQGWKFKYPMVFFISASNRRG